MSCVSQIHEQQADGASSTSLLLVGGLCTGSGSGSGADIAAFRGEKGAAPKGMMDNMYERAKQYLCQHGGQLPPDHKQALLPTQVCTAAVG